MAEIIRLHDCIRNTILLSIDEFRGSWQILMQGGIFVKRGQCGKINWLTLFRVTIFLFPQSYLANWIIIICKRGNRLPSVPRRHPMHLWCGTVRYERNNQKQDEKLHCDLTWGIYVLFQNYCAKINMIHYNRKCQDSLGGWTYLKRSHEV